MNHPFYRCGQQYGNCPRANAWSSGSCGENRSDCFCRRQSWNSRSDNICQRQPWSTRSCASCQRQAWNTRSGCDCGGTETTVTRTSDCGCGGTQTTVTRSNDCGCGGTQTTVTRSNDCGCTDCNRGAENDGILKGRSLAMVYSPYQNYEELYDPRQGLCNGTIFCNLNKPFYGDRRC